MSWRRGQAYAQHLRDRLLAATDRGMRAYEAASLFQVSASWIYRALARRRARLIVSVSHGHWMTSTSIAGLRHDGIVAPCLFNCVIDDELFPA
jgi:hypothetical protein